MFDFYTNLRPSCLDMNIEHSKNLEGEKKIIHNHNHMWFILKHFYGRSVVQYSAIKRLTWDSSAEIFRAGGKNVSIPSQPSPIRFRKAFPSLPCHTISKSSLRFRRWMCMRSERVHCIASSSESSCNKQHHRNKCRAALCSARPNTFLEVTAASPSYI